jgi:hypothetical protein
MKNLKENRAHSIYREERQECQVYGFSSRSSLAPPARAGVRAWRFHLEKTKIALTAIFFKCPHGDSNIIP